MLALAAPRMVSSPPDVIERISFNVIGVRFSELPFIPNRRKELHNIQVMLPTRLSSSAFGAVLLEILE